MRVSNQRKFISGIIALILGIMGIIALALNGFDKRLIISALLLIAIGVYNIKGSQPKHSDK